MDVEVKAKNVVWHNSQITRYERRKYLRHHGCTIWLTGLPAAGKSTTAFALERALLDQGYAAYVLDGDNIRHGLNKDLGFSAMDRQENIRRVGEVAGLFADSGMIVITSFISPYREERAWVRRLHRDSGLSFLEVFVDTPVEVCEDRDPKGQYAKARRGELHGFTGVDDPYEPPLRPDITLRTAMNSTDEIVEQLLGYFQSSTLGSKLASSPSAIRSREPEAYASR